MSVRTRIAASLARGRARRAAFLARREELNAAGEADMTLFETKGNPLYQALAEHCESGPWRDRVIIGCADLRAWRATRQGKTPPRSTPC